MLACSWIPIPFLMTLKDPSLYAPEHVTSCNVKWYIDRLFHIEHGFLKFCLILLKSGRTRHVFVKHGCPRRQQSQNMAKISKSYIMTSPHPPGHGMSVKCEEPLDELTVQVWLLYLHLNFNYWTLSVSRTELRTDGQTDRRTDGQMDGQTIRLLDAPGGPFRPGA